MYIYIYIYTQATRRPLVAEGVESEVFTLRLQPCLGFAQKITTCLEKKAGALLLSTWRNVTLHLVVSKGGARLKSVVPIRHCRTQSTRALRIERRLRRPEAPECTPGLFKSVYLGNRETSMHQLEFRNY